MKEAIVASMQGIKLGDILRERDTTNQDNMEEEAIAATYWCYVCFQTINPVSEMDIQCPFCHSGFVEELERSTTASDGHNTPEADFGSDRDESVNHSPNPALDFWFQPFASHAPNRERERERVAVVQGSYDSNQDESVNHSPNPALAFRFQPFASYAPNRMSKFNKHAPAWDFIGIQPVISDRFKQFEKVADLSFLGKVSIFCDIILQHSGFGHVEVLSVTDSTISLGYILSLKVTEDLHVTENEGVTGKVVKENVHLIFKRLGGHFTIVYGSLSDGTFEVHRLCFDENIHTRNLASENETFELWKKVRNGLALPLMNDACRKAKLKPPTHLMDLPKECFFEILKRLPAVDITMMACSSKEMKQLFLRNMFLEEIPVRGTGRRVMRLSSSSIHPKQG